MAKPFASGNAYNGLVIITGPFYFWRQQRASNAPPDALTLALCHRARGPIEWI
jgi:hypothetical protein